MTKEKKETKCDDLIDALLEEHGISQEAVLGENGLIAQLKKRVVERALAGELTHHLGYARGEAPKRSTTIATATARRRSSERTERWRSKFRGIGAEALSPY
jgi:transposase-like protein